MIKGPSSILTTPKDAPQSRIHMLRAHSREKERERKGKKGTWKRKASLMAAGRTQP